VTFWEFANRSASTAADERFEDMDHDNDGIVVAGEWHGSRAEFERLDRNDDRVVTLWEYANAAESPSFDTIFRDLDRDRDGLVSRREWPGDAESFAILDSSSDRALSRAEFRDRQRLAERFRLLDDNRDDRLSRQEWSGSAATFAFFDRDRNGVVTRDEFLLG
jgi:hypothetical protein